MGNILCFLFIPKALMMRKQHGATSRESIIDGLKFVMNRESNAGKNFDVSTLRASGKTSFTTASGSIRKMEDLKHVQFTPNTALSAQFRIDFSGMLASVVVVFVFPFAYLP